jgi:TonB family protein
MNWTKVSIFLMILAIPTLSLSQDTTSGGPDSIIAGSFGEPRMVMSEGGEWSYPIKVFANDALETFVPDITSPGWISWHIAEFRQEGTYVTYLYIYHRKSHNTGRETVYVDTKANTAIVVRPLLAPNRVNISKAPLELSKSIATITAIVTKESKEFHGMTVQESVMKEKYIQARMALCSGPGNLDPDCKLSDLDFQKKHPIYVTNPQQLIQGAQPGVNCGIGTNRSCYYYAPENIAANRPASLELPPAPQTNAITTDDDLYRVGGEVSAPVLLNNVAAGYTDEARRAKYQGVCHITMVVDAQGNPQNPRIVRGLEMGLNEKALEAVRKYKFKPAMKGNSPVPVMINVEINFRLY